MPKPAKSKSARPDVTSMFVAAAKHLPEVRMILVEGSYPDDVCVWTIIDAPPFERSTQDRVAQVVLKALQEGEDPPVDFHLINLRELTGDLQTILPTGHRMLFKRAQ